MRGLSRHGGGEGGLESTVKNIKKYVKEDKIYCILYNVGKPLPIHATHREERPKRGKGGSHHCCVS